jgi:mono/diheme cytochrome c family protein
MIIMRVVMKNRLAVWILLVTISTAEFYSNQLIADTINEGKVIFNQRCSACHKIGGGRLVGPDLAGVSNRRSEKWLRTFIKTPMSLVNSGDETAVAIFEKFNKMPMPDQSLSNSEIDAVLTYVQSKESPKLSDDKKTKSIDTAKVTEVSTEPDIKTIQLGAALFQGKKRFSRKGASCFSCHTVNYSEGMTGGGLAADLTNVSTRMGSQGIKAILKSLPFPAMKVTYSDHPLTDEEIEALAAFFTEVAKSQKRREIIIWKFHNANFLGQLLLMVLAGCLLLLGFYGFLWRKRKRNSVNQDLFDRQRPR